MSKRVSDEDLRALGGRLRALREDLDLTQLQVAKALGISEVGYGHFERGERLPSAAALPWLASGFGVSVEELLARLGLVDQKILNTPLPEAIAGRLQRIVANYEFLNKDGKDHVAAILGLAGDYARSDPDTTRHPDSQPDPRTNDLYPKTGDCREVETYCRTPRALAMA